MDKKTIILKNDTGYPDVGDLSESEQIWRFAGDYFSFFNRKKYIILLFCLLGAVAGLAYAFSKKTMYVAEVKFTSNVDNDNMSGYMSLAQQFGLATGGSSSAFSGDNLMALMKTPSLINQTLFSTITVRGQPVLFIDYYLQSKKIRQKWADEKSPLAAVHFNTDLSKPDVPRDSVLKMIDNDIAKEISIDKTQKELNFISVRMTDEDPVISKEFTETLVKTVTDYYVAITTAKYKENVRVFQEKADSLSRNFGHRLSVIASSQDINVNPSRQISNVPIQKQQMNAQVDNAVYEEVVKNLELSKIQLQKQTPFVQVIETPRYPLDQLHASKPVYTTVGFLVGAALIFFLLVAQKELAKLFTKLSAYGKGQNAL